MRKKKCSVRCRKRENEISFSPFTPRSLFRGLATVSGLFIAPHHSGSLGEYRIKTSPAHLAFKYRPRVNARLMPEAEPRRRSSKYLGWVAPLVVPLFSESERRG
jgi:hypothetical protein